MNPYATIDDFEALVHGWTTDDEAALQAILDDAARDVDAILWPRRPQAASGFVAGDHAAANSLGLDAHQREALKRATVYQAEWRIDVGEKQLVRPAVKRASGPDFSIEHEGSSGSTGRIGPKVWQEIRATGLLVTGARARP